MVDWKIKYYFLLIVAFLIVAFILGVARSQGNVWLLILDLFFAVIVVILSNRYMTYKEPELMEPFNAIFAPDNIIGVPFFSFLILLAIFLPIAIFIFQSMKLIPSLFVGKFYFTVLLLPSVILCTWVFLFSKKRLTSISDDDQNYKKWSTTRDLSLIILLLFSILILIGLIFGK